MHLLYLAALAVVIGTAVWIVLDPAIECGITGILGLGGLAVSAMAATEWNPEWWVEWFVISLAALCIRGWFGWCPCRIRESVAVRGAKRPA